MVATAKRKTHSVPCTQEDNISNMKSDINEIKADVKSLHTTIDGNGKPGMKTDLALLVSDVSYIKKKLSASAEIDNELEIQRRVVVEVEKREKDRQDVKFKKKGLSFQTIATIVGALSFIVMAIFAILNYELNKKTHSDIGTVKSDVENSIVPTIRGQHFDPFARDTIK